MNIPKFQRWLESRIQFAEWLGEYGNPEDHAYAGGFVEEAYHYAVSLRLPECAETCKPGPATIRLMECLNAIPKTTLLTPPEIAEQLAAAPETVVNWIKSGQLKGSNLATAARPRYVVDPDDLAAFLKSRQPQPPVPRKEKARSGYRRFSE